MKKKDRLFATYLLRWDKESNERSMPWKGETDAYKVWLSEIILQQTRLPKVLSYYQDFVRAYPKVEDLAKAPQDEVLRLWQGLGYYSRARNLHFTAKDILENYGGNFPNTYKQLLKLKGVGSYTAAAIASFVFGEKIAVVDGNVIRVLARYFGIEEAFDTGKGKKMFDAKAKQLIDEKEPARYNQAIMDFGAVICTPKNPSCTTCPFQSSCFAFQQNKIQELPFKSKKLKIKKRFFIAYLVHTKSGYAIRKRAENDIWKGLFELPMLEISSFDKRLDAQVVEKFADFSTAQDYDIQEISEVYKQKLTHQEIQVVFATVGVPNDLKLGEAYIYTRNLSKFAFPKIFILYLRSKSLILD